MQTLTDASARKSAVWTQYFHGRTLNHWRIKIAPAISSSANSEYEDALQVAASRTTRKSESQTVWGTPHKLCFGMQASGVNQATESSNKKCFIMLQNRCASRKDFQTFILGIRTSLSSIGIQYGAENSALGSYCIRRVHRRRLWKDILPQGP